MRKLKQILIVDDDPVAMFIIKRIIKKVNLCHDIYAYDNPGRALEFLQAECEAKKSCPELMIVDINMPFMDGFEFLENFRKLDFDKKEEILLVMLSTSSAQRDIEKSKAYKINAFLNKPLTEEKLLDVINSTQINRQSTPQTTGVKIQWPEVSQNCSPLADS